jgi:integrase
MQSALYDAAGHRRSPVTMRGFHEGSVPRNKGRRYPADPPTVEEIIAVMREAGSSADGARLRALIVILWRAGLRIGEALDLAESGTPERVAESPRCIDRQHPYSAPSVPRLS